MYPRKSLILTASVMVLSSFLFGRAEGSPSMSGQALRSSAGLTDDSSNKSIEFVGSFGGPITAVAVESTLA